MQILTEFTESYNGHENELTELNELGSWVKNSEWMEPKKLDSVAKSDIVSMTLELGMFRGWIAWIFAVKSELEKMEFLSEFPSEFLGYENQTQIPIYKCSPNHRPG